MHFTNRHNLPQYLFDWLKSDDYDHNADPLTLSTTTLLKPVQAYWLSRKYADELEIDAIDLLSSKFGNAIHNSIEQISTPNVDKEQRVFKKININGVTYTLSGKYDLLVKVDNQYVLRDIKTTSVWTYIHGGKDDDYQKQLSVYRWLLHPEYNVADVAYIDFFFTDWQSSKAKTDDGYPEQRIHAGYRVPLMSLTETENYIISRIQEFFRFQDADDHELPECTKEELWATDDTYAVMKPGAKRALRVLDTRQEANTYILNNNLTGVTIELRSGKAKRCKYCAAAPFCRQFSQLVQDNMIERW